MGNVFESIVRCFWFRMEHTYITYLEFTIPPSKIIMQKTYFQIMNFIYFNETTIDTCKLDTYGMFILEFEPL